MADRLWPYRGGPDHPDDWDHDYEKLAQVLRHARALCFAQGAILYYGEHETDEYEHGAYLADLGVRVCEDALDLADDLSKAAVIWKRRVLGEVEEDGDIIDQVKRTKRSTDAFRAKE